MPLFHCLAFLIGYVSLGNLFFIPFVVTILKDLKAAEKY